MIEFLKIPPDVGELIHISAEDAKTAIVCEALSVIGEFRAIKVSDGLKILCNGQILDNLKHEKLVIDNFELCVKEVENDKFSVYFKALKK